MQMLQAIAAVDDRRFSGRQMRVAAARLICCIALTILSLPARALGTGVQAGVIGRIRPTVLRIEAETLLAEGAIQLRGGQVSAQPMTAFGPGWSGDAQLFRHGGAVGDVLDLMIENPQDGSR